MAKAKNNSPFYRIFGAAEEDTTVPGGLLGATPGNLARALVIVQNRDPRKNVMFAPIVEAAMANSLAATLEGKEDPRIYVNAALQLEMDLLQGKNPLATDHPSPPHGRVRGLGPDAFKKS